MESRWSDDRAAKFLERYSEKYGDDLAMGLFVASLIGAEQKLVLHGGGNSSIKTGCMNLFGESTPTIFVKASGYNMAHIMPNGYTGMELQPLRRLRALTELSDEDMVNEFRIHFLCAQAATPSIETLVHVFIPHKFVDHTHPDSILALSNQADGEKHIRKALGDTVALLPYCPPGFKLAKAVADKLDEDPSVQAVVLMQHGLITWGETGQQSYAKTIELTSKAEAYLRQQERNPLKSTHSTSLSEAEKRFTEIAPAVRGLLAKATGNPDHPWTRSILRLLVNKDVLNFVDSDRGKNIALTPPLTSDHLIRTKPFYLWIDSPDFTKPDKLREQFLEGIREYASAYDSYIDRHMADMPAGVGRMDPLPRVILVPGMGAICAGQDAATTQIISDIAEHTLAVKAQIAAMGTYSGMSEKDLFDMEYRALQHAKLQKDISLPLAHEVAIITGGAGAIGSGIAQELLRQGCHVAITDLEGSGLHTLVDELKGKHGDRVMAVPLDVTDPVSVARGFSAVTRTWGGIDLVVLNAGIAHVSPISEMSLESFRKLSRINVEGTLIMLSECIRHFRLQGTGGDIVLVSTKNVFAPGAKFGAYSATKAAGHQLARIASQEFAELGVRVNMVAPDAVFSHGMRKSGLWTEIGPERMSARGLSPEGLEEYYRNRNLLKARITAQHVANAVLFFATRQTPTTGATIPVDGGLPDATPR